MISGCLAGRKPGIPHHPVCFECEMRGTVRVMVAHGTPCPGPVSHTDCGAICPAYGRGLLRLLREGPLEALRRLQHEHIDAEPAAS